MASSKPVAPDEITKDAFEELLSQYPSLIEGISESKGAAKGQRTLQELDHFRYVEAPEAFGHEKRSRSMTHEDVKTLVEWKLRHGKFRPTLMNLVSSNPAALVHSTIHSAITAYRSTHDAPAALATLSQLRGVGPATASLLLSVHDPSRAIFFSDEAFYWLCCGGAKASVKYTAKEYDELRDRARALVERLGVSATEIEKVAYVLMKQPQQPAPPKGAAPRKASKLAKPAASSTKRRPDTAQDAAQTETAVRRSKRVKT